MEVSTVRQHEGEDCTKKRLSVRPSNHFSDLEALLHQSEQHRREAASLVNDQLANLALLFLDEIAEQSEPAANSKFNVRTRRKGEEMSGEEE
ncbi:hypothetical protein TcWFU_008315 [Taenia crassiceps]|uniref:Uncharacterized protein n=1 Tax=Taenia crassiceps TaxID=6207 RepID=A0ABR4QML1_9CEST